MKILAIGLGSAGCRIADTLLLHDRKSGTARCVDAIAVDHDEATLTALRFVPDHLKIFFSPLDPDKKTDFTRSITSDEIVAKLLTLDRGELDAIIIVCGLGGGMTDLVPALVREIRVAMQERIFALVTLPRSGEGETVLSKAASDVEMLTPLLDGVILFDNDRLCLMTQDPPARPGKFLQAAGKKGRKPDHERPAENPWKRVNQHISRRFGLLLRAGEINEDEPQGSAEVVLDAGEVLRTMTGMGLVAIGYATEKIPEEPGGILRFFRRGGETAITRQKKAERIVDLARKALGEELSVGCDLASAEKALVLILGPSRELSMKGFMAVRKWIDQSIAGPEMRSGDYPVENTQYVGIIIVLAGIHSVPRIQDLMKTRSEVQKKLPPETLPDTPATDRTAPGPDTDTAPKVTRITLGVAGERIDAAAIRSLLEKPQETVTSGNGKEPAGPGPSSDDAEHGY